jgi:hypothetical protein
MKGKPHFHQSGLDDGIALAAVAQATTGVTALAGGGYMLQYRSVELRIRMRALDVA